MADAAHKLILAANQDRDPDRLARKYRLMRDSVFSFYRGTCHLFLDRLVADRLETPSPAAWCCNDLHLENFGTYRGDNQLNYFDLNDFDEAALAPAEWEIIRLAASILIAGPELAIKAGAARKLAEAAIASYAKELQTGKARWVERRTAAGPIGDLMKELRRRDDAAFLDKRTERIGKVRRLRVDGKRALPLPEDGTRERLEAFTADFGNTVGQPDAFRFVDAARRVAGTASLGIERYAILVAGDGTGGGNVLLDLKAVRPSAAVRLSPCRQPDWESEAHRVVTIQSRCQAIPPAFLYDVMLGGQPFIVKELQPTTDRLDLASLVEDPDGLRTSIMTMGRLTAWAQLRASGRQGAATADDLVAFGGDPKLAARAISNADVLAARVIGDWKDYCQAFDDNVFSFDARSSKSPVEDKNGTGKKSGKAAKKNGR